VSDDTLCYIHLWRDKAGSMEPALYTEHREAMEAVAEEWPSVRYMGTVVLPRDGQPTFEDWSEAALNRKRGGPSGEQSTEINHRQQIAGELQELRGILDVKGLVAVALRVLGVTDCADKQI
jgi:hypothetical protein